MQVRQLIVALEKLNKYRFDRPDAKVGTILAERKGLSMQEYQSSKAESEKTYEAINEEQPKLTPLIQLGKKRMQKKLVTAVLTFITPIALALSSTTKEACPQFPFFLPKTGALAVLNCDFHQAYENRLKQIIASFGTPGGRPIILQLGGVMSFKYNDKIETTEITPTGYHNIKAFAHSTFATYLLLSENSPGQLSNKTKVALTKLQHDMQKSNAIIPTLGFTKEGEEVARALILSTQQFIDSIIKQNHWSYRELNAYFKKVRPLIQQAIKIASALELKALDTAVNRWLGLLSDTERARLGIVVATSHQARAREISLQYFAKKFGLKFGEGALYETQLVVLEGKFDETSAISTLARHYLDREAAEIILGDADRLQYDLLADAAHEELQQRDK